jgi:hypothetical protein
VQNVVDCEDVGRRIVENYQELMRLF